MNNNEIRAYEGGDYAQIEDSYTDRRIQVAIANRAGKVVDKVNALEDEIEEIKNSPDVVDIVPNKAALDAYDKSSLTDKDVIRVLADETHDGASTYYRYNKSTNSFTYIGTIGEYYTKSQTDNLLSAKQNTLIAGDNITITNDVISATASGGLPTNTTFWGQTVQNGVVNGTLRILGDSQTQDQNDDFWITKGPQVVSGSGAYIAANGRSDMYICSGQYGALVLNTRGGADIYFSRSANMQQHKIVGLADPTVGKDAANKDYVDNAVASVGVTAFPATLFNEILENA